MSNKAKPRPITTKRVAPRGQVDEEKAQLQMAVLNMRQMYESAVQEKLALQEKLTQAESIIAGKLLDSEDFSFTVTQASLELAAAGGFDSISVEKSDVLDGYLISAVFPAVEVQDEPLSEV